MGSNDPRLVASTALAKAQSVEARLNAITSAASAPQQASIFYGASGTVVTQSANGLYTWTCPAGVTSAQVECWGGGAGGGGGGTVGGVGGGGGEYACEPSYPVVPGQVYYYQVGAAGAAGPAGVAGATGEDTVFDLGGLNGTGVYANGGNASAVAFAGSGGTGGNGSPNTIAEAGGAGGGSGSNGTGGCGGGGSGGSTGTGGNGVTTSGSTGGAGGAAGSGSGNAGGAGGANGVSASAASSGPGAGGGGSGATGSAWPNAGQNANGYRLSSSMTYRGSDATGGNANTQQSTGTISQGGETSGNGTLNGTMKGLGIIQGSPSSDLSGATIDSVFLQMQLLSSYYAAGAYLLLGYTNRTGLPGTWNGAGITALRSWVQGGVRVNIITDLTTTGAGAALKSGAMKSIAFGLAPAYSTPYYCSIYGAGGSNNSNPFLVINWHTGAAPIYGGAGVDGQVKITYSSSTAMTSSVQPTAGTDATGNAFAVGYTGPVTAIQPGSNPAAVEAWHTITMDGSWSALSGYAAMQYRLLSDGNLQLAGAGQCTGRTSSLAVNSGALLPLGYRPASTKIYRTAGDPSNGRFSVQIDSTGLLTAIYPGGSTNGQYCEIDGIISLL